MFNSFVVSRLLISCGFRFMAFHNLILGGLQHPLFERYTMRILDIVLHEILSHLKNFEETCFGISSQ